MRCRNLSCVEHWKQGNECECASCTKKVTHTGTRDESTVRTLRQGFGQRWRATLICIESERSMA